MEGKKTLSLQEKKDEAKDIVAIKLIGGLLQGGLHNERVNLYPQMFIKDSNLEVVNAT